MTKAQMTLYDLIRAEAPAELVLDDASAELSAIATRIRASHKRHVDAVIEIGADLLRAKQLLAHGKFLPWLQAEFRWSERAANNYMAVAEHFAGKSAIFADLDLGSAYALAAKSTPTAVREEVVTRIEAGERIEPFALRTLIADARERDRKARTEAKKTPEQREKEKRKAHRSRQAKMTRWAGIDRERAQRAALDQQHRERVTEAMQFLRDCLTAEELERFRDMIAGIPCYKLGEPLASM